MNRYLLALFTLIFIVGLSLGTRAAGSYSRGPYLPQNSDLVLAGQLLARGGLMERCEDRSVSCDPFSEHVLTRTSKAFEYGKVTYDCIEIDDGAYGALSCKQNGYAMFSSYKTCVQLAGSDVAKGDLLFNFWDCQK